MIGQTVSHYRIDRRLGEGGMGVVYAATDLKLERPVALKLLRSDLPDRALRERFWREARAAAALNHPAICQVHEIGEADGAPFIVMELLEGESLADRIARGPFGAAEAIRVGLEVLNALAALHRRSLVHRDVKPSNVFVLADGRIKLLDFGLVLPVSSGPSAATLPALTMTGMVVGSPGFMSPEQIRGTAVDGRTDLFALGAVLYQAIAGRPAFHGITPLDAMHSVLHDSPPRLPGGAGLDALDRVIRRALAKSPDERYPDAETMAADLRALQPTAGATPLASAAGAAVRLAVLPFRLLRSDADLEFLGPSLADAIAMSLAGIRSLVVRSPLAAARFATATPDFRELAREMDVDAVLVGTLLPAGERCRVAAQLVEVPDGKVSWSLTEDVSERDIFQLQDALTRRIVESLQLPLSARERQSIGRDVPASPTAFEYFLRANRMAFVGSDLAMARDLYLRALESDPHYAPAWVRLARCYRVMGKYYANNRRENYRKAEEALARAFELHADIPAGLIMQSAIDLDMGRIELALDRLLGVVERNPNDPEGWAWLVTAFRYLGLLDESLAAHRRARALDPEIKTSIVHTLDALGEYERAAEEARHHDPFELTWMLYQLGRADEAMRVLAEHEELLRDNAFGVWLRGLRAVFTGKTEELVQFLEFAGTYWDFPDPEGVINVARVCARLGETETALRFLEQAVGQGFANAPLFRDPSLVPLRDHPRFQSALQRAEEHHQKAAAIYGGRIR